MRRTYAVLAALLVLLGVGWLLRSPRDARVTAPGAVLPVESESEATAPPLPQLPDGSRGAGVDLVLPDDAFQRDPPDAPQVDREAAPPLVVSVLHADGAPANGAVVAVSSVGGELLAEAVVHDDGRCSFAGWDGGVRVHAAGVAGRPAARELDSGRGAHELRFAPGATLSGRVLVDGRPPERGFPLGLEGDVLSAAFEGFPGSRWLARQSGRAWGWVHSGFLTNADGTFKISDLPPGWVVRLTAPQFYRRDEARSSPVDSVVPVTDYVLALRSPEFIEGRVLTADGVPAQDAHVGGWVRYPRVPAREGVAESRSRGWTFSIDELDAQGRFCVSLPHVRTLEEALAGALAGPEPGARLDLELDARSERHGTLRAELEDLDASVSHDLGDLYLVPSAHHELLILDLAGEPIADASVRPDRAATEHPSRAWRSGADGRVSFLAAESDLGFASVVAAGRKLVRVELPESPGTGPIEVRLEHTTALEIEILPPARWPRDEPLPLNLRLTGGAPLFEEGLLPRLPGAARPHDPDRLRRRFLSPRLQRAMSRGSERIFEATVETASVHLEGLRPHLALRLAVGPKRDVLEMDEPFVELFWESDSLWLEPAERRTLVIDLRDLAHTSLVAPDPASGASTSAAPPPSSGG